MSRGEEKGEVECSVCGGGVVGVWLPSPVHRLLWPKVLYSWRMIKRENVLMPLLHG